MGHIGDTKNKSRQKNYRLETDKNSKEILKGLEQSKRM